MFWQVEASLYDSCKGVNEQYKKKAQTLKFNLSTNEELREQVQPAELYPFMNTRRAFIHSARYAQLGFCCRWLSAASWHQISSTCRRQTLRAKTSRNAALLLLKKV